MRVDDTPENVAKRMFKPAPAQKPLTPSQRTSLQIDNDIDSLKIPIVDA